MSISYSLNLCDSLYFLRHRAYNWILVTYYGVSDNDRGFPPYLLVLDDVARSQAHYAIWHHEPSSVDNIHGCALNSYSYNKINL